MKHASILALAATLAAPAVAQPMARGEYVATAGASDLYERLSSDLVLQTTRDPKVRDFARMMIAHHTKSTEDVNAAAARSNMKPTPAILTEAQKELIAQLSAEPAASRDACYIAQQKASHNQALEVQKAYAREGDAPALREAAGRIVPVVERHVATLRGM